MVAATTIIPSLLAIPCYLMAGLKYKQVKEQMIVDGKLTQKVKEDTKNEARYDKYGARDFDVFQYHLHSESVNFEKFTKSRYELAILDALNESTKRKRLID